MSACCSSAAARKREFSDARYREVTARAAGASLKDTGAAEVTSYITELEVKGRDIAWKVRQAVEVTEAALYRFDQMKSKPDPAGGRCAAWCWRCPSAATSAPAKRPFARARPWPPACGSRATSAISGNVCTPAYLADQALALGRQHGLKVTVLDEPADA